MNQAQLKARTLQFALDILNFCRSIRNTWEGRRLGDQLFDAASSVAANYRAACRGRSKAEFIAKIGVVVEEADETTFWLELLVETGIVREPRMRSLMSEANELLAIFAASQYTARGRRVH